MPDVWYERVVALPAAVRALCHSHGAWVVGSGAAYLLGFTDTPPRDWDVLVPLGEWPVACKSIPKGTPANGQGGFKLTTPDFVADVWADDLGRFLSQASSRPAYAVHPKTMTHLACRDGIKWRSKL